MHIDEEADESTVHGRVICDEGIADLDVLGTEAYITGHKNGTLIVVAETDDGIKDRVFLS